MGTHFSQTNITNTGITGAVLPRSCGIFYMKKHIIGKQGEEIARRIVARAGLTVVAQNVHTRYGELDIVAHDGQVLHVIEVKTRTSDRYGSPEQAITPQKLLKMRRTVSTWLVQGAVSGVPRRWQLDVIAITLRHSQSPRITWYRNVGMADVAQ